MQQQVTRASAAGSETRNNDPTEHVAARVLRTGPWSVRKGTEALMRNYRITINGKTHLVAIEDPHACPVQVEVDGKQFEVYVDWVGTEDEARVTPEVSPDSRAGSIAGPGLEERRVPPPRAAQGPPRAMVREDGAAPQDTLTSPMPGTILSIAVNQGEIVELGQEICVLEAMKMKNSIRSPRQGTISEVAVTPGATVAYGDLLVRFE